MGSLVGLLPKILPLVPGVVGLVERLFKGQAKAGAAKRVVAVEVIQFLIMLVEGISGKDLVDDVPFAEAIGQVIDGVVAALNARNELKQV